MILIPITLKEANEFVDQFHRHQKKVANNGGKFAIACGSEDDGLIGVAIVGNPVSASMMDGFTAEVLRLCVRPNTPKNACSMLYGACWRAWRAMGGKRLVTYTLATESGGSLRGAGWKIVAEVKPHNGWNRLNIERVREWNPIYGQKKFRWEIA